MNSGSSTTSNAVSTKTASSHALNHRHHPVRSPLDRHSSPRKSASPSPERVRKRPASSRGLNGHVKSKTSNGHDESEAETDILSDEQSKIKVKKRLVKHESTENGDDSTVALKSKSEPSRSSVASRASSVNGEVSDKKERKSNGNDSRERAASKTSMKERLRLTGDFGMNSSRAHSADASSPHDQSDRPRQIHSAEPRKRKFSDAHRHPSKLEPPRQKPRLDDGSRTNRPHKHRPSSPPTPGTPGLRSHRRSVSTQSNLQSAGLSSIRKRREVSNASVPPKDSPSDMSSDEAGSYPPIPTIAPPPRSGRATYRAMTSPVRTAPVGKRADRFGSTPLAKACEKGNFKAVKTAYEEAPGEIDQADNGGFAPLQKAALEGHADIVEFLLEKGCRKDCCSKEERDTPLIDAVENGHMEVVKLLLDHGVNPHHSNKNGKRAIDAIDEDDDYAPELREMLQKAMQDYVGSESDDESGQEMPVIRPEDKNRADLLYLEPNHKNLLEYSRKGDVVAVDHFLSSVKPSNEHAVVAARGGHDVVLNLLLASAGDKLEKDPDPSKYDETPLLATIGRGHMKILKLLLQQDNFNPTRLTKDGKTYWEVAEERRGPRWQTERDLLKEYSDAFTAKRKVQKKKKVQSAEKLKIDKSRKQAIRDPSSSPQAIKERKLPRKLPNQSSDTKENKRKCRPVVGSSESELSEEEIRPAKKTTRNRTGSMVGKEPPSPVTSRHSSGQSKPQHSIERKTMKENGKLSRKTSGSIEKRHSTSSERKHTIDAERGVTPPVKAETPDFVREAREAEKKAKAEARAAKVAEAERQEREAEEAAAKEKERKAEEERVRKEEEERLLREKQEKERKQEEERLHKEKVEREAREERERRIAVLPKALRVAVQKGSTRPLHFRPATKEHPEEVGISAQFLPIETASLRSIDSTCDDNHKDELWMMNFQVVGILGLSSELQLAEFPGWEKRPVSREQRDLFLKDYHCGWLAQEYRWPQPGDADFDQAKITAETEEAESAFLKMEPLLWVRYKDFVEALEKPEYKHLAGLQLKTRPCRIQLELDLAENWNPLFDDSD